MVEFNATMVTDVLVRFIHDAIHKNSFNKGILGVSGGLDSAVVLVLAQKALGSANTHGLLMPYRLSDPKNLKDARVLCEKLDVSFDIIDITPMVSAYFEKHPTDDPVLIGNKCARERMSILYDFSARLKALVVGTSNKSELLIGYSTLYGDSAAAFQPIGDLYKTQVDKLAEHLGVPKSIIVKKPSADLWKNQTDEGEIGISYARMDEILYQLVDLRIHPDDIEASGIPRDQILKIQRLIESSHYKRTMPPVAKLQQRTVGIDFRYLRDWKK